MGMTIECPYCFQSHIAQSDHRTLIRKGSFYRRSDGQHIARYWCKRCRNGFSSATSQMNYGQRKRQFNERVRRVLCAKVSQREAARVLGLDRKTIARKLAWLGIRERRRLERDGRKLGPAMNVQFDDLETFLHTKCKPVSVTMFVEARTRRIIDWEVAQMPAKGHLAHKSLKRYGVRNDHRGSARKRLFTRMETKISPTAKITSDSNPHYLPDVRRHFPTADYRTIIGGRSSSTGQGELKKQGFDPIFSLNHTYAMLRDHLGGLVRKTWGSHRCLRRLDLMLAVYAVEHNSRLSTA